MVTKVRGFQLSSQNASDDDLFKLSSKSAILYSPHPTLLPFPLHCLDVARPSFITVKNLSIWTMTYLVQELHIKCIFHSRREQVRGKERKRH